MSSEIERESQIENYVHERMNEEDKASFENLMMADESLRNEVSQIMQLKKYYQRMKEDEFKKKIHALNLEVEDESPEVEEDKVVVLKPWYSRGVTWAVAASCVLLIGSYFMFFRGPDYIEIADNALMKYSTSTRGLKQGDPGPDFFYSHQQYQDAILKADELLKSNTNDTVEYDLKKIIALSKIGMGNPEEALRIVENLEPVDASNCEVEMIRAIAYIKMKKKEEASRLLSSFKIAECGREHKIAQEILMALK